MALTKTHNDLRSLWADFDKRELDLDSKKIKIAVDMAALLVQAGVSRKQLSDILGWKPSRVTKVLSGRENLTIETILTFVRALSKDFDIVFRNIAEREATQSWNRDSFWALQNMRFEEFPSLELRKRTIAAANDEHSQVAA